MNPNVRLNPNGIYDEYLRKSRTDIELERYSADKEDTLKRHEKMLDDLAKRLNIKIRRKYKEVVSGENIQDRPEIQKLLSEIETGNIDGVLVVEVERLARGDTKDQGTIAQAFKYSDTKIITPTKIYDPNNEYDEEYFEFGLYMSRREYKTTTRRLQRGRISSVYEGKYVGSSQPFGYTKVKLKGQKGFSLEINEKEAKVVREIYKKRLAGIGHANICNYMNGLDIKPLKSDVWTTATVKGILSNPIYAGKIRWNYNKTNKILNGGQVIRKRSKTPRSEWDLIDGLHKPIIDIETWEAVQNIKSKESSSHKDKPLKNSLATLIKCKNCGRSMARRPYSEHVHVDTLICIKPHCETVGSHFYLVEDALIQGLKDYANQQRKILSEYNPVEENNDVMIQSLNKDIDKVNKQLNKAYDLVEQGIYTNELFIERTKKLNQELNRLNKEREKLLSKTNVEKIKKLIPKIDKVLEQYNNIDTPEKKNKLLKSVIDYVVYDKKVGGRGLESNFELEIHPKL